MPNPQCPYLHLVEYDVFFEKVEARDEVPQFLADILGDGTPDTPDNRRLAYNRLVAYHRDRNELCQAQSCPIGGGSMVN